MGPDRRHGVSDWDELVRLAERELELVRDGDGAELPAALARRAARAAILGQALPADRPALERLAELQDQLVIELTLTRDEAGRELAMLRRGRGAVQGYRSAAGADVPRLDGTY
jgi:hypothetical protein